MRSRIFQTLLLFLLTFLVPVCPRAETALRVGIYQNRPGVFMDEQGRAQGFYVQILQHIAEREKWRLHYVPGTWAENYRRLEEGEIDLLLAIAYTHERSERFHYTEETVFSNWGQVYVKNPGLHSILDLKERHIVGQEKDIYATRLKALLRRFDIPHTFSVVDHYGTALEMVTRGQADAAVISRANGLVIEGRFDLFRSTIVCCAVEIRFAAPKGRDNPHIALIDRHIANLKKDKKSIYYSAFNRWFGGSGNKPLPQWIYYLGIFVTLILVLVVIGNLFLRRQVTEKTRALIKENEERRAAEKRLQEISFYDTLTGLPNRTLFKNLLEQEFSRARRTNSQVVVFFLDLDRFKDVNDTLGHSIGDRLLQVVAKRLKYCVRDTDAIARLGGDEFAVILIDVEDHDGVVRVARRILEEISKMIPLEQHELNVGVSIGIAIYPDDGDNFETLTKNTDAAMYRAKECGRNNYQFYTAQMNEIALYHMAMEKDLRLALERNEFTIYFQPKVDLATDCICGMEALVRWNHQQRGMVSPGEFIQVSEKSGLIVPLGYWILKTACATTRTWIEAGYTDLRVAVNLSGRQLQEKNLIQAVRDVLAATGLAPENLELEITESMLMDDLEHAIQVMNDLRRMGVFISIDDFGTGYSSLSYLKKFPIHALKIDQSFVRELKSASDDAAIVSAIISMGHNLGLKVIAEGVETGEQKKFLKTMKCDQYQGYYRSRPIPAEAFIELLEAEAGKPTKY